MPAPVAPRAPDPDALPSAVGLPPEHRAIQVVDGVERVVDAEAARAAGLTIVDLSDGWAPSLFDDGRADDGSLLPNRYRDVYAGLANDRSDGDGVPLPRGAHNYLELYGIPPSLSVMRQRFISAADMTVCWQTIDIAKLLAVDAIETWGSSTEKKELQNHHLRGLRLEDARKKVVAETLEVLAAADRRYAKEVKAHARFLAERAAFGEIEKRLACEGLMDPAKHKAGLYDTPMRLGMLDFQQKNVVMSEADINRSTLEALARPAPAGNFATLRRVLAERAAHAGGFIEDGSAAGTTKAPVPNLVDQATDATLARLGLASEAAAAAFFQRHPAEDFRWLKVAVRFPAPPEYYAAHMDLSAEIDRGDIWYDFPFDKKGQRLPQPRAVFPSFTLFVKWRGQRVPLVKWRTTIGSWRSELAADGEEYLRYKDSDVGPRVWHHIVAAPVWLPPANAPMGGMVKQKWENGAFIKVTNYDETGPGYLSAYGLAAAIHEEMRKRGGQAVYYDNGIRTHGSFDYTSLRGRFSHGCHRLYNNLAVRLFSFVLKHRHAKVLGPIALNFRRTFPHSGEMFDMRLPTRGFYYELDPPLPVETLEGEVRGVLKRPILGYVRKPGVIYRTAAPPADSGGPESKAGGGSEAP